MKTCKRCNGNGMPGYKHNAAGMCFACGKFPQGEQASETTPGFRTTKRERDICQVMSWLARAADEQATGDCADWWSDVLADVRCLLGHADADVARRAIAAFAKLGLVP